MNNILKSPIFQIVIACLIPFIGGFVSSFWTKNGMEWSQTLNKPSFNPPGWIFGPVWTLLYISMGYASYRVWSVGGGFSGEARTALIFFIIQMLLNWAWPPIFFGFHLIAVAAVEIVVLLIFVIITALMFYRIDGIAGLLFIPYIAWLSFASFLNYNIWKLN